MVLASVAAGTLLVDFIVVILDQFLDPFISFLGRNQRRTDPTSSSGSRPVFRFLQREKRGTPGSFRLGNGGATTRHWSSFCMFFRCLFFFYYSDRVEYRAGFPYLALQSDVFDLILELEQMCCNAAPRNRD